MTLFLDGVDALPLELQPKLLRFLETRTFRPLGASTERRANVRIVAATQRDLKAQVDRGQFRQDLYFRLQGVELGVPPLRERPEDLPLLIRDLLAAQGRAELTLPEALLQRLVQHPWPGNVRELRTLLERFLVSDGSADAALDAFRHSPAPLEPLTALPFKAAKQRLVDDFTREYLAQMLERAGNNVTEAARLSGIARTHFHELLAKYGVTPDGAG